MRVGLLSLEGLLIGTHAKVAMMSTLFLNDDIQLLDELDERSSIDIYLRLTRCPTSLPTSLG